ncbi:hypothetical protein [Alicyclobacillus mali (ex Roth et al. 2021)]|uniref:hypothetical protein n=1 Tax=Alicyclobacillus mali (ex Roth et al. 2021) TaxID=1123961 RepID=UPI0023F23BE1|nr:hypothetical protein [Alicyclobacillus mali (ex Roth et al. 2021)]
MIFVPELAQVLLPWWVLGVWLEPTWWVVWAPIGAYILGTHVALRWAARKSQREGFQRVISLPVARFLVRALVRGRVQIPRGVPCYLLHIRTEELRDVRRFRRELEADIRHGFSLGPGFYVGNTYSDVGVHVRRFAPDAVTMVPGTFFPRWLQCWGDVRRQQRQMAGRAMNEGERWYLLAIHVTKEAKACAIQAVDEVHNHRALRCCDWNQCGDVDRRAEAGDGRDAKSNSDVALHHSIGDT